MPASMRTVQSLALGLAVVLGGCALTSATGYQRADADGGYTELQLAPDMFRVAFQGNTYTSQEQVADMALLRAADLALAHGAPFFVVINQLRETRSLQTPPVISTPYVSYGYAFWGHANAPIIVRDHRAELAIRLLRDEPGPGASAYSALLLRDELSRRYGLDRR